MIKQFFSGLRHIFFISSVFLIIGASCNKKQEVNKEYEIKSITETINSVIGWAINKDFDRFFNSIANDSDFISVTPYKRVKFGFEEVKRDTAFWANPKFKAISHELKDLIRAILPGFTVFLTTLTNGMANQQIGKMLLGLVY